MPLYEYQCVACETEVEVIQKFSDEPLEKCEKCGEDTLKRKTSLPSFQLKGTGWYKDGYSSGESSSTKAKASE
ncbi:MAG: putative FmdB family regulatory protein [bacterium]|jgi:putative FmdB family regulatory protein